MNRREILHFLALRTLGNFLLLVAFYGVFMTFGPALGYEFQYRVIELRHIHFAIAAVDNKKVLTPSKISDDKQSQQPSPLSKGPSFADILSGNQNQILTPIDPLFSILIPKLGIDEKVVANVDPNDPNAYLPVLQHAIAHAKGSVFPGDFGTTYLFAHSTDNWWDVGRYNAVFYTLSNLSVGDEIDVFYNNRRYTYTVTQQLISSPEDVTLLTSEHSGPSKLVLQTCWPPGTSFKRLYVIAAPKKM
ncbi:MAG TPA: sortase [Candidatus Saccharimonadales bacterium]|nr:sortase [Candidatus Saccharimonadales bacterium]